MEENDLKVKGFTFYRNYYEIIKYLSPKDRLILYDAISGYIFEDIEPNLDGMLHGIWLNISRPLDKSKIKSKNGQTSNQEEIKTKSNENQNNNQEEIKTKSKGVTNNISTFLFLISNFILNNNYSNNLKNILEEWIKYKQEKKDKYTEIGFKKLLAQIKSNVDKFGEEKIIALINECMANNWKGIIFEKLESNKPKEYKTIQQQSRENLKAMRERLEREQQNDNSRSQ